MAEETKSTAVLRKKLTALGCLTEKLAGGMFQNGIPDLLVGVNTVPRHIHLIEMKWVAQSRRFATQASILDLLRTGKQGSRQFAVFAEWAGNGWPFSVFVHAGPEDLWCAVRGARPTTAWLTARAAWSTLDVAVLSLWAGPVVQSMQSVSGVGPGAGPARSPGPSAP